MIRENYFPDHKSSYNQDVYTNNSKNLNSPKVFEYIIIKYLGLSLESLNLILSSLHLTTTWLSCQEKDSSSRYKGEPNGN